jgi:hypothetical protein
MNSIDKMKGILEGALKKGTAGPIKCGKCGHMEGQ